MGHAAEQRAQARQFPHGEGRRGSQSAPCERGSGGGKRGVSAARPDPSGERVRQDEGEIGGGQGQSRPPVLWTVSTIVQPLEIQPPRSALSRVYRAESGAFDRCRDAASSRMEPVFSSPFLKTLWVVMLLSVALCEKTKRSAKATGQHVIFLTSVEAGSGPRVSRRALSSRQETPTKSCRCLASKIRFKAAAAKDPVRASPPNRTNPKSCPRR